jgi:hypothetical protein
MDLASYDRLQLLLGPTLARRRLDGGEQNRLKNNTAHKARIDAAKMS